MFNKTTKYLYLTPLALLRVVWMCAPSFAPFPSQVFEKKTQRGQYAERVVTPLAGIGDRH